MGILQVIGFIAAAGATVVFVVKLYFKMIAGVCKSKRRIDGQVAIITGANSGKLSWFCKTEILKYGDTDD